MEAKAGPLSGHRRGPVTVLNYDPGTGRRYALVITELSEMAAASRILGCPERSWLVTWANAWPTGRSVILSKPPTWMLLEERLDCLEADAKAITLALQGVLSG